MKKPILMIAFFGLSIVAGIGTGTGIDTYAYAYAAESTPAKETGEFHARMQMHEKMAKAHQEAADCLKSGKTEMDCKSAFRAMCKDAGGYEMCGHMSKHYKKGKMKE